MQSELVCALILTMALVFTAALPVQNGSEEITAQQILRVAPSSNMCPTPPGECATNSHAAPFLNQAMSKYQISSRGEKASILALIAYESGNLKYNINHFPSPGQPGQGTRNMQSASYNLQYIKSIPELTSKISFTSIDGLSSDQLNNIRSLVLPDEYSWASAAWYLTQKSSCSGARQILQAGRDEGFIAHMKCVGVSSVGSDRLAYWEAAKVALSV